MARQNTPLATVVDELAGTLEHESFPKGDLAELRRMKPSLPPPAFWRVMAAKVPGDVCRTDRDERAWSVILQGMAIMAPAAHAPTQHLGKVLAILEETAENRLWSLLRSRDEQLEDQIRLMARFLAAKERRIDWLGLARLLLARDEPARDSVCRDLARSFYYQRSDDTKVTSTPPIGGLA